MKVNMEELVDLAHLLGEVKTHLTSILRFNYLLQISFPITEEIMNILLNDPDSENEFNFKYDNFTYEKTSIVDCLKEGENYRITLSTIPHGKVLLGRNWKERYKNEH